MLNILLAAAGGAIGAAARYALGLVLVPAPSGFPTATLVCNLLGCAAIGLLSGVLPRTGGPSGVVWVFVAVGLLGGFTTFSSFSLECLRLAREGHALQAAAYIAVSNIGGIALALVGALVSGGLALRSPG
ncbi:MAG: fluoride efflux transporter CrcB [Phycisphaerales bacterium]